ncbi:DNA invertase Pin-like site-specific DNA recombinase [Arthrobacter sp. UYCu511]
MTGNGALYDTLFLISKILIGYARVSIEAQDLAALGVESERIYFDHCSNGRNKNRAGLREAVAVAAGRAGDTFVVTKLDRLARSVPDAHQVAGYLAGREIKLSIGSSVHDPTDPMGKLFFNVLAMIAEFEASLISMRTREGMKVAKANGGLRGNQPKLTVKQEAQLLELHDAGEYAMTEMA